MCKSVFEWTRCSYGCGDICSLNQDVGGIKTCKGQNCMGEKSQGRKFIVVNCQKCFESLDIEDYKIGAAYEDTCPRCKHTMTYYFCTTCNKLNQKDAKCSRETCPKPETLISYVKKEEPNRQGATTSASNQQAESYEEKECKTCCA